MRIEEMSKAARAYLLDAAAEAVQEAAKHESTVHFLADKYKVPEHIVANVLKANAVNLTESIARL
jgi:hypothetical protein